MRAAVLAALLCAARAASPEAIECMVQEDQGNCLQYITGANRDFCVPVIAECMRESPYDVIKAVNCCEEQGCYRDELKPESLAEMTLEMVCMANCMKYALPNPSDIWKELQYIFNSDRE